jgi:hypothetical protein
MPVPIYNAGQGLLKKPPKLVEFEKELKKAVKDHSNTVDERIKKEISEKNGKKEVYI